MVKAYQQHDTSERTVDVVDQAQEINELHQRISLEAQLARSLRVPPPEFDGTHCIHCGDPVELQRRVLKLFTCFDCQSFFEKYHRAP